ncbi:ATP-dependent DNA helicase [Trametopsis cervina]|nr:ATP-dependent DNA helicase [Trametopsis cervina]
MTGPRNNLDDVLRRLPPPGTPSAKSSTPQGSTSKGKFKPAAASTPSTAIPGNVTVRKTTSYTSFATASFGKTRPAPLETSHNSTVVTEKISISAPQASSSTTTRILPGDVHSPGKRASPASFSNVNPPSKRPRPSLEPEKENVFESDTQAADVSDRDDSGYVSFRDKGKGRELPSFSRTTPSSAVRHTTPSGMSNPSSNSDSTPSSLSISRGFGSDPSKVIQRNLSRPHVPTSETLSHTTRIFEFDYGDLMSMSVEDLKSHKFQLVDARSEVMTLCSNFNASSSGAQTAFILRKFDEIFQDRLQCVEACIKAGSGSHERELPKTKWLASLAIPPAHPGSVSRIESAHRLTPLAVERSVSGDTTTATTDDYDLAVGDLDISLPNDNVVVVESDDELWDQVGSIDHHNEDRGGTRTPNFSALSSTTEHVMAPRSESYTRTMDADIPLRSTTSYSDIAHTLKHVFKLQTFRQNQLEAITSYMAGHDVFVLMPTGGGKSLCFQLPAVCKNVANNSVTIVIGPLLSLMLDQVMALEKKGLDIAYFAQEQTGAEANQMHARLNDSGRKPCLVYVTPEKLLHSDRLKSDLRRLYQSNQLGGIVVDEAHCITTWGRSFRDSYTKLGWMRQEFPKAPFMALTATANRQAVEDIIDRLGISGCKRFTMSFNRSNLYYEICPKRGDNAVLEDIATFIKSTYPQDSGIVYCNNKSKCELFAETLRKKHGFRVAYYHADLSRDEKARLQDEWQSGKIQLIIATIAFGMGIDKPDVRFVIHFGMPSSLSNYYQETGRAGRDGKPSHCRLYYAFKDALWPLKCAREDNRDEEDKEDERQNILRVVQYCQNKVDCRRVQVLNYFDERFEQGNCNKNCDNCHNPTPIVYEDVKDSACKLIEVARETGGTVTRNMVVEIYLGKTNKSKGWERYNTFAIGKGESKERAERIFDHLCALGILELEAERRSDAAWTNEYVKVPRQADKFIAENSPLNMGFRVEKQKKPKQKGVSDSIPSAMAASEPGPSRPRAKRANIRAAEIPDDPISLYVSDDDNVQIARQSKAKATRPISASSSIDPVYTGSDFASGTDSAETESDTQIMIECRTALTNKIYQLQGNSEDDLTELFNEDVVGLLCTLIPADIEQFRDVLMQDGDFDIHTANAYIPALVTECIKYRARLDAFERKRKQHHKPISLDQYGYHVQAMSKPASRTRHKR